MDHGSLKSHITPTKVVNYSQNYVYRFRSTCGLQSNGNKKHHKREKAEHPSGYADWWSAYHTRQPLRLTHLTGTCLLLLCGIVLQRLDVPRRGRQGFVEELGLRSGLNPGVLLGIRGGGVPPRSPNPDPISDQNIPFSIPVFRPGL